jgi:ADP-ribose pyrophosphatase YjhB (NUDIX family)
MAKDYIRDLRKLIGNRKIIHPAARIFLENEAGEILLIKRIDNGNWGIPAGAMEEGESISECIKREVREETGLNLLHAQLIGIASEPDLQTIHYPNGDVVQYMTAVFYSNAWEGSIKADGEEVSKAQFFPLDNLPDLPENEAQSLPNLFNFKKTGQVELY